MCLFIILQIVVSLFWSGEPNYDLETLLYQATIPGFDEEPMFRGILLFCISLAIISERYSLGGASINIAGLLLVVLFGLVHGVMFNGGEWHFSFPAILLTGGYGFILLWLRERTGSLVFPILAHNSVNFVGQLI
jgi:membrane protease YdiL (CAAX protease family)